MESESEVVGVEELLLLQRALVDRSLCSLEEDAPPEELLEHFRRTVLALQRQEPAFWQLQIVEFIGDVLTTRVGERVRAVVDEEASKAQEDPSEVVASATTTTRQSVELEEAVRQLNRDVRGEVARLEGVLNEGDGRRRSLADKHFLESFWSKVQHVAMLKGTQDGARGSEGIEEIENCSFSMLTFDDDLNDISRSAMSFPCMEDFPIIIRRMQSPDKLERAAGLDELMQMPVLEIIHSGPIFPAVCTAVVNLFLDTEARGEKDDIAGRAKRVTCDLSNQVEDATQFLVLYWAVIDFMGSRLEAGDLFLDRHHLGEATDVKLIAVLDCYRVLHTLVCQVTRHWVYFSAEALARLYYSTFRLLIMYSKSETEVETKLMCPLVVLALIHANSMQWFRLWLLNSPNPGQLCVALDETGFVADLLQYLSRVRPLAEIKAPLSSTGIAERRTIQVVLIVLSRICEYYKGRKLLRRWKRVPAHAYIKQRHVTWETLFFETKPGENDALYHVVRRDISEEEHSENLEADYEYLGAGAIDALILSSVSVILTNSIPEQNSSCSTSFSYDTAWTRSILKSVSTYFHNAQIDVSLTVLLKLVGDCLERPSSATRIRKETETESPWFPFRQPKDADEVCRLINNCVSRRIRSGALNVSMITTSGLMILLMIISSEAVTRFNLSSDLLRSTLGLCKSALQTLRAKAMSSRERVVLGNCDIELIKSIANLVTQVQSFEAANNVGVIDELIKICTEWRLSPLSHHITAAICHSSAGIRYMHNKAATTDLCIGRARTEWQDLSSRRLLSCLALPPATAVFFRIDDVQATLLRVVSMLQENCDFTLAVNSPEDESPHELYDLMRTLQLLKCCLSTQHASMALLSINDQSGLIIRFIVETLSKHNQSCMSSSTAEDTCCLALQLALALTSSVPAMLACSGMVSELNILHIDDKNTPQCEWLSSDGETLGSCALLEQQLQYDFEFIGGPSEKCSRCELFTFDGHSRQCNSHGSTGGAEKSVCEHLPDFASALQHKILQAIKEGVEAGSSAPMDYVLISQASWELVNELEAEPGAVDLVLPVKSTVKFARMFAQLIYSLVVSKRSRLEPIEVDAKSSAAISRPNAEAFFPPDSDRKLMNRLYKNYARRLSLDASSTLLHSIIKKFGKVSMDCFPVTILMLLHSRYEEAEILNFLSCCIASPSAGFLWPSAISLNSGNNAFELPSVVAIAEAVEVVLKRELPQVLQVIEQCNCSLLSIVQRWHDQHFWNYFDWENIVIYTYLSILYGAEFQVYIIIAILKHLEPVMRELTARFSTDSLTPFLVLMREPIRNFRFSPWRALLLRLRSEYHEKVASILFPFD